MAKELVVQEREAAIVQLIRRMEPDIKRALPTHLKPERMLRIAITCIRKRPKLAECDQRSLLSAILELSQLGLEPDTNLGHAWILPYASEAQVIIGYKGYISLAARAGIAMQAEVVRAKDNFRFRYGTRPLLEHTPYAGAEEPGDLTYSYAIAHVPNLEPLFHVCPPNEIMEAKRASAAWRRGQDNPNKRDSPWYTYERPMWQKTAIRRLSPFVPMSPELSRALELDDQADRDERQVWDIPIDLPALEAGAGRQEEKLDAIKRNAEGAVQAQTPNAT